MLDYLRINYGEVVAMVRDEKKFTDESEAKLHEAIEAFKLQFIA